MDTTPESIPPPPLPILPAEKILFDSFQEYFLHFWQYLSIAIIVSIPLGAINIGFDPRTGLWYMILINFIGIAIFGDYATLNLLSVTEDLQSNKPVNIGYLLLSSLKIYFPFFLTMLMVMVIFMFGLSLCCIPGIIIGTFFCLADGIVVWEGIYGIPALKRSFALVKPYFWRVLWVLVLFYVLFLILNSILREIPTIFIPELPSFYKQLFHVQANNIPTPWWFQLYRQLISAVMAPIPAILTYILYRKLKETQESKLESLSDVALPVDQ